MLTAAGISVISTNVYLSHCSEPPVSVIDYLAPSFTWNGLSASVQTLNKFFVLPKLSYRPYLNTYEVLFIHLSALITVIYSLLH